MSLRKCVGGPLTCAKSQCYEEIECCDLLRIGEASEGVLATVEVADVDQISTGIELGPQFGV